MSKRLPLPEWFAQQTTEKQLAYLQRVDKRGAKKKGGAVKKKRQYRKKYSPYGRKGAGGMGGTNIVYPNIVGRGPYYLEGGVNAGPFNARGGYASDISLLHGRGPYYGGGGVSRNSMIDLGTGLPKIVNSGSGESVIISHKEYIKDIISGGGTPTAFALQEWSINPGNSTLFPWLSQIARNFQEYEIRGMVVLIRTMSSDFSANFQLGSIFGASSYNVHLRSPDTKQEVEMMEYATSCKPSRDLVLAIECEPQNNGNIHKYIAVDAAYNGGDPNTFDWGKVFIGSAGLPNELTPIGEMWITYEVAFFKPILNQNTGPESGASLHWHMAVVSATDMLGEAATSYAAVGTWNGDGFGYDVDTVNNWVSCSQLPPGYYMLSYYIGCEIPIAAGSVATPAMTINNISETGVAAWVPDTFAGNTTGANQIDFVEPEDVNEGFKMRIFQVSKVGTMRIEFSDPDFPATGSINGDLWINRIDPDMKVGVGDNIPF
ncbi:capsid protein [Crucivirus-429]|nr:capsid protein [Crucivirus-429]